MIPDKSLNIILAGVADLTDFETPNRIFISKLSSQKFMDPGGKYENIVIYPNPFLNDLAVFIPYSYKPPFKVQIADTYGRTILNEIHNTSMICLSIKEAPTNTLILKVSEPGGKTIIQKLLIKI